MTCKTRRLNFYSKINKSNLIETSMLKNFLKQNLEKKLKNLKISLIKFTSPLIHHKLYIKVSKPDTEWKFPSFHLTTAFCRWEKPNRNPTTKLKFAGDYPTFWYKISASFFLRCSKAETKPTIGRHFRNDRRWKKWTLSHFLASAPKLRRNDKADRLRSLRRLKKWNFGYLDAKKGNLWRNLIKNLSISSKSEIYCFFFCFLAT